MPLMTKILLSVMFGILNSEIIAKYIISGFPKVTNYNMVTNTKDNTKYNDINTILDNINKDDKNIGHFDQYLHFYLLLIYIIILILAYLIWHYRQRIRDIPTALRNCRLFRRDRIYQEPDVVMHLENRKPIVVLNMESPRKY